MGRHLIKVWHEQLFKICRENTRPVVATVELDLVPIIERNIEIVSELRGPEYVKQFRQHLSLGDFGYYAYYEGKPVGYGWVKHPGSKDFFFKIDEGCCYLCRFFVREEMRGKKIYPNLITALIEKEIDFDTFYIAVERGNIPSERGVAKIGFQFCKEYAFWRVLKHTINKQLLR